MALYWIYLFAVFGVVVSGDDTCPSPKELAPCTCDGEGLNCMGNITIIEIKKAFRANFKYGGVRSVWIQGTLLTYIPSDIFGNVKSRQFYIEVNHIITADLKAFNASRKTLQTLSLFGNKIQKFPFSDLSMYERLGTLNLGRNQIESIPDNAFNNQNLETIILAQNKINHIGKNAFRDLLRLQRLELSSNVIATVGPMSFAFKSHNEGLQINLAFNKISEISPSAFTGASPYAVHLSMNQLKSLKYDVFGNLITRIAHKGGFIEVSGNPFSCKGCDYSWVVNNKQALMKVFVGFACTDGRSIIHLNRAGIEC